MAGGKTDFFAKLNVSECICLIQLEVSLLYDAERQDKGLLCSSISFKYFQLSRLQSIQKTRARIVTRTKKFDRMTPIL